MYMYAFACNSNMNRPVPCFHAVDVAFRLLLWTPNGSGLEGLYSTKVLIKVDYFLSHFLTLSFSLSFSPSLYISLFVSAYSFPYISISLITIYIFYRVPKHFACWLYIVYWYYNVFIFPRSFQSFFFIFIFRLTPTEKPGRGRKCLDLPHSNAK